VTRKARVGRATFYAHYASKDALLTAQLSQVVLPMLIAVPDAPCPVDATRLFAHVLAARPIYRSLCVGAQCAGSERIIHDALERHVARCLAAHVRTYAPDAHAPGIVPRFVAGALQGLITWALEQDSAPDPARLQQAFGQLIGHALTPPG